MNYNGERRAVCDDGFNDADAMVACRELTGDENVISYSIGHQCAQNAFWLDDILC
jgi:hypothetical protein